MMSYHLLTGDSLAGQFAQTTINGKTIISRECFIEGPCKTPHNTLPELWELRARYLKNIYGEVETDYKRDVAQEFEQLLHLPNESEVNLWFEYDLFCQVNMWFSLWLLQQNKHSLHLYRVFPVLQKHDDIWKGFSRMQGQDLQECLEHRVPFTQADIELGAQLWEACRDKNSQRLYELSLTSSLCFPHLTEVCQAEIDRETGRPIKTLQRIIQKGVTEFPEVFQEFLKAEGIYGFGDLQVKQLYEKM